MKVMHLVNDASAGGAQRLLLSLAAESSAENHLVVLMGRGVLSESFENGFTSVRYLDVSSRRPQSLLRAAIQLLRHARRVAPDVRHSHLAQSDLLNYLVPRMGALRFTTVHNSLRTGRNRLAQLTTELALRSLTRFHTVIACDSSAATFLSEGYGIRSRTVRNGIRIPNHAARRRPPVATFISVARWHPQKAHDLLLESFSRFLSTEGDGRLVLVGEGLDASNDELAALIDGYGLADDRVELVGYHPTPERLMSQATALVFSSRFEGLPIAGLEAIAQGLPVVTTDVGGCRDLVTSEKQLAASGDAAGLADAMIAVNRLDDPGYQDLSERSRQVAIDHFDIEKTAAEYDGLYGRAVRSRGRSRRP